MIPVIMARAAVRLTVMVRVRMSAPSPAVLSFFLNSLSGMTLPPASSGCKYSLNNPIFDKNWQLQVQVSTYYLKKQIFYITYIKTGVENGITTPVP